MHMPKGNPRLEYRLKQKAQIEASPFLATKFPELKALKLTLEFFDATGTVKNGEMNCKLNVEHARSVLWYACRGVECVGGDFELGEALAHAVADRRKAVIGELRCQGTRKRGDRERESCRTLLRYTLGLTYH